MNSKQPEEPSVRKEDTDSGVDNTSESGHSGDEDHGVASSSSSDFEDLFSSDNESNCNKKEPTNMPSKNPLTENLQETALQYKNDSKKNIDLFRKTEFVQRKVDEVDVRIELNNNDEFINDEYTEIIKFYKDLALSQCETIDFSIRSTSKKPDWFDEEKFKRGQKFARDHLFCINFAEMLSLFILFAQKSSLGPLIFTGKSDSPFTAFRRYLNTLTKLMSWYEDDIWNESESLGTKNLTTVRGMHKNVYHQLTNSSSEELAERTTLGDPNTKALWCPLKNLIAEDFRETFSLPHEELNRFEKDLSIKKVWMNQADMSMTQFGFVGLAVTYPEYFGIYFASDEDLDAFLHLWRSLGYLLGIKDKYNYCSSNLNSVRLRTKFFLEAMAKPAFRNVTCDWEHMCRCVTAGISYYLPLVNFESSLLYLCHILKIQTPRLKKQVSFGCYIIFQIHKLTFYLMRFRGVLNWLNSRLYEIIRKVQNAPPEVLAKWENKEFSYLKQPGKSPIRSHCPSRVLMSALWGEYENTDSLNEEVIPAEIIKLFIMKAMQPDGLRTPLTVPSKPDTIVKVDVTESETLGLEIDDKVIHSIKLIQYAKEMSQLIEATKEQTEFMADTQIRTFPNALDIPEQAIKLSKFKLNHPIQYMDKEFSEFSVGKGSKIPEITGKTSKHLLKKSVATLLAHAGYHSTTESVLNTLTDVAEEYVIKMTNLLRVAVDQGANSGLVGFPDAMERVFHEMNIGSVRCIHDYYQNKVIMYHKKLMEESRLLNQEYNNISIPIKTESFPSNTIDKIEEQDDVPEIHFPALGEEGVNELQPSLEPGFQMLHSLEQEAHFQSIESQEDDINNISGSPIQEVSAELFQAQCPSKKRKRI